MNVNKATFTTKENSLTWYLPIQKVDRESRIVSGFATLDNVDKQDDIITAKASEMAFAKFRGNIREQHRADTAVGKMLNFRPETYFDPESNTTYNGIYVDVYVSKGAPLTWEKCIDGTIQGFSVGGNIEKATNQWSKTDSKNVRVIDAYSLAELSLVDSPCNSLANIASLQKSDDGVMILAGMVSEVELENVFWCEHDKMYKASKSEDTECSFCNKGMKRIDGWIEKNDNAKFAQIVQKHISETTEGGEEMSDKSEKVDEVKTGDVVKAAEKVDEVKEVDFEKMIGDLKTSVDEFINKSAGTETEILSKVDAKIEESTQYFKSETEKIETAFDEIKKALETITGQSEELGKRLETLESATAIRKSADKGGDTDIKKSATKTGFGGVFTNLNDFNNLDD